MAFPKTTLLNSATTIQNAKTEGFNTAQRVGKMFVDLINETAEALTSESTTRGNAITTLQSQILTAQQKADLAYNEAKDAKTKATAAQTTAYESSVTKTIRWIVWEKDIT